MTFFLISVKPEYVRITKDESSELQNASTIGPFTEGEELTLTCESGGGKPIPSVIWWNGTHKMTGKFLSIILMLNRFIIVVSFHYTVRL
jgi:hypothetical protein